MGTTLEYDQLVARLQAEAEAKRMHKVTQMSEAETAKEIAEVTEGVFIEPIPVITPTAQELEVVARAIEPKKRGRPKGSRNRPKV